MQESPALVVSVPVDVSLQGRGAVWGSEVAPGVWTIEE